MWAAGFWGRIVGYFFKIPTVHTCHTMITHNGFLRNTLDRLTAKLVNQTVAASEGITSSIDDQSPWMKGHPVKVIKNEIDVD